MLLKYVELHSPLFLAGTNLQMKLDIEKRRGLVMEYDRQEKELKVTWNGDTAYLPCTSVFSMVPVTMTKVTNIDPTPDHEKRGPGRPAKAQVSTPQDHVFAGPGFGKTK
jgi:hypothetical protein